MAQPVVKKLSAGWIVAAITMLGAVLRAWQLASHPLWSDEFATLVFSLGHGFAHIPLDQLVTGNRLLEVLTVQDTLGAGATWDRLLSESNHPPLYFFLSNGWIHLWQGSGQLVDLGVARSLPALFGVLAIPGTYALTKLASERNVLSLISALLMAVSPFAVYLSQETRHYTLGLVWGIASLMCWVIFLRHWNRPKRLPRWHPWVWILVNGLGIATHFFVGLLLLAQGIAIGLLTVYQGIPRPWKSLAIATLGTAAMATAWVPYAQSIPKNGLTDWLSETVTWTTGFSAISRLIAWTITM
ncbi:MAG: glycosyltransferase family 39 protein, partial [Cyanobacteria bacterium P01_F01_bin.153]